MRRLVIVACFPALLVLLGLAGCAEQMAEVEPGLVMYQDDIFNTEGVRITDLQPDQSVKILCDQNGRQCYALLIEDNYVLLEQQRWLVTLGEPSADPVAGLQPFDQVVKKYDLDSRITGRSFRFYDCRGQLQHTIQIDAALPGPADLEFYFAPDGDLQKSLFLVNRLKTEGKYQLLDIDGNLLVEKQLTPLGQPMQPADLRLGTHIELVLGEEFVALNYAFYDMLASSNSCKQLDVYDLQGRPLPMLQVYDELEQLAGTSLYKAHYRNEKGRHRYDVLDDKGQVYLANLLRVEHIGKQVLELQQGWGDLTTGLADLQGRWLKPDLWGLNRPLQVFYYNGDVYNTYGKLIAKNKDMVPDGQDIGLDILGDKYVLATEYFYPENSDWAWRRPQPTACQLTLYDAHGRQLWQQPLTYTGANLVLTPLGKYGLLNYQARLWLEREVKQPYKLGVTDLFLTDYFVVVKHSEFDEELQTQHDYVTVYDWLGKALPMPREYVYLNNFYVWDWWLYQNLEEQVKFFEAGYKLPNGQWLFDVLDERGRQCLSDLQQVDYLGQSVFAVRKGFSRGLMNEKGEWLYQESIFVDLED